MRAIDRESVPAVALLLAAFLVPTSASPEQAKVRLYSSALMTAEVLPSGANEGAEGIDFGSPSSGSQDSVSTEEAANAGRLVIRGIPYQLYVLDLDEDSRLRCGKKPSVFVAVNGIHSDWPAGIGVLDEGGRQVARFGGRREPVPDGRTSSVCEGSFRVSVVHP